MRLLLPGEAWASAGRFVAESARPLDRALFAYHFAGGSAETVLGELATYQNPDGGFGNWLESDFALPASSATATAIALDLLQEVGAPASHRLVWGAISYLLRTFVEEERRWHAVPPAVNDWPHAPWWHYDETRGGCLIDRTPGNPGAELTGYLTCYRDHVPPDFLAQVTTAFLERFQALPEESDSMHELYCYTQMFEALPAETRKHYLPKLRRLIRQAAECDPDRWDEYGATPLFFARYPASPFADLFPEALEANLDFLINEQEPNGSWKPNWSWGQYEDVWPEAARRWSGHLTVHNLLLLRRFGRLERPPSGASDR